MLIWNLTNPETQEALKKLYRELAGHPFKPPGEPVKRKEDPFKYVESVEEIDILMRIPPRGYEG